MRTRSTIGLLTLAATLAVSAAPAAGTTSASTANPASSTQAISSHSMGSQTVGVQTLNATKAAARISESHARMTARHGQRVAFTVNALPADPTDKRHPGGTAFVQSKAPGATTWQAAGRATLVKGTASVGIVARAGHAYRIAYSGDAVFGTTTAALSTPFRVGTGAPTTITGKVATAPNRTLNITGQLLDARTRKPLAARSVTVFSTDEVVTEVTRINTTRNGTYSLRTADTPCAAFSVVFWGDRANAPIQVDVVGRPACA